VIFEVILAEVILGDGEVILGDMIRFEELSVTGVIHLVGSIK
jgi:hypothetical protein